MIDAILWVLEKTGSAAVSLWTWTIASYEVEEFEVLRRNNKIDRALLVIDGGAREKNGPILERWRGRFGDSSVRYVRNHAKIATVEGGGLRVLLRGSMNLNHNPRFEQLDITEGGDDFDLVRGIEAELPILTPSATGKDVYEATRLGESWGLGETDAFKGLKTWAK